MMPSFRPEKYPELLLEIISSSYDGKLPPFSIWKSITCVQIEFNRNLMLLVLPELLFDFN